MPDNTDPDTTQHGLDDYGITTPDTTPDPPRIKKQDALYTTQPDTSTFVGWRGHLPDRNTHGFVKPVTRDDHHYHSLVKDRGGAYAISDDILAQLPPSTYTIILVVERDTGHVLEYDKTDFNQTVPKHYLHDPIDPQTYAPCDTATTWRHHATDVYTPRGSD